MALNGCIILLAEQLSLAQGGSPRQLSSQDGFTRLVEMPCFFSSVFVRVSKESTWLLSKHARKGYPSFDLTP